MKIFFIFPHIVLLPSSTPSDACGVFRRSVNLKVLSQVNSHGKSLQSQRSTVLAVTGNQHTLGSWFSIGQKFPFRFTVNYPDL